MTAVSFDIVIPTVGRPSLAALLRSLAACEGPQPGRIFLVDDRADRGDPLLQRDPPARLADRIRIVHSGGGGPAAARNTGWRRSSARWIAFLDDDVLLPEDWLQQLQQDLQGTGGHTAASQGRIRVPLPDHRAPTDWERNVAGLEIARWATADMAYRRAVLHAVGGFDERFRRAYREDADLGLRVTGAGWRIVHGRRTVLHPVRPADDSVSVSMQAGNAEDPFMRLLHGSDWRDRAGVGAGRRPWHLATVGSALAATVAAFAGRRWVAATAAATWAGLTADFAWRRIEPGPRDLAEVRRMAWTSVVVPFAATWHWVRGVATAPRRRRRPGPEPELPAAVLFDRDGTLVHDVPYNGDPDRVAPVEGAREVLDRLRELGVPTGVVSNQSGVGRGMIELGQVAAVNRRIEALLGPIDVWAVCPHAPDEGCRCRKPSPGLIERAALRLGVDPHDVVVIGDIGSDMEAAMAAGARAIMVPTDATRQDEVAAAPEVASDLLGALELALSPADRAPTRIVASRAAS